MTELIKLINGLNLDQLLTAGGFVIFVVWLYWRTLKERDAVILERNAIIEKYEDLLIEQNNKMEQSVNDYNSAMNSMNTAIDFFKRTCPNAK